VRGSESEEWAERKIETDRERWSERETVQEGGGGGQRTVLGQDVDVRGVGPDLVLDISEANQVSGFVEDLNAHQAHVVRVAPGGQNVDGQQVTRGELWDGEAGAGDGGQLRRGRVASQLLHRLSWQREDPLSRRISFVPRWLQGRGGGGVLLPVLVVGEVHEMNAL
jgi:hypothetical protein